MVFRSSGPLHLAFFAAALGYDDLADYCRCPKREISLTQKKEATAKQSSVIPSSYSRATRWPDTHRAPEHHNDDRVKYKD